SQSVDIRPPGAGIWTSTATAQIAITAIGLSSPILKEWLAFGARMSLDAATIWHTDRMNPIPAIRAPVYHHRVIDIQRRASSQL
ncbi:hypothetical protein WG66_008319, partial [Moniliophthora roreri]